MMKGGFSVVIGFSIALALVMTSCFKDDIPDFNEQLQKDIEAIDSHLTANNITGVEQDPDGLIRYVIHRAPGTGNQPTIDSCVTASYTGKLMVNGQQFDNGVNISFPLYGVIDGWKIGMSQLHEGDSATLYIPSGLAYGYAGYPPEIPKNANLIFHVALNKVGRTYKDRSCN